MFSKFFHHLAACFIAHGQVIWEAFHKLALNGLKFYNFSCVPVLCYSQKFS